MGQAEQRLQLIVKRRRDGVWDAATSFMLRRESVKFILTNHAPAAARRVKLGRPSTDLAGSGAWRPRRRRLPPRQRAGAGWTTRFAVQETPAPIR
jgi:hypothetical protein